MLQHPLRNNDVGTRVSGKEVHCFCFFLRKRGTHVIGTNGSEKKVWGTFLLSLGSPSAVAENSREGANVDGKWLGAQERA